MATQIDPSRPSSFGWLDLALIGVAAVWGVNNTAIKLSLQEMTPLAFNGIRFSLAAALSCLWLAGAEGGLRRAFHVQRRDLPSVILLALAGHTVYQLMFIQGISRSTAGNTSLILATSPVLIALMASLSGRDRLRPATWLGVAASAAGTAIVVLDRGGQAATTAGDLIVLSGTLFWAGYTVFSQDLLRRYSPLRMSALTLAIGAAGLLVFAAPAIAAQNWSSVSWRAWAGLIYSSVFANALGYAVWNHGVQRIGSARTSLYSNLSPIFAVAAGWWALNEPWSWMKTAGAALILGGVALARSLPGAPRSAARAGARSR